MVGAENRQLGTGQNGTVASHSPQSTVNLKEFFPEIEALIGVEQNPRFHPEGDVFEHTMLTLDAAAALRSRAEWPLGFMLSALCHDIGTALGCGGCMSSLRRTMAAGFTLSDAVTLEQVQEQGEALLSPTDLYFRDYEKYVLVNARQEHLCRNGNPVGAKGLTEGKTYRVYGGDGEFLCISRYENGVLTSIKNFFGR